MTTIADLIKDPSKLDALGPKLPEAAVEKELPPLTFPVTRKSAFDQALQITGTKCFLCSHPGTPQAIYLFEVTSDDQETGVARHHFRTKALTDDFELVTAGEQYLIRNIIKPNQFFPRFEIRTQGVLIQELDFTDWKNY